MLISTSNIGWKYHNGVSRPLLDIEIDENEKQRQTILS